jgi:hypothetical protein
MIQGKAMPLSRQVATMASSIPTPEMTLPRRAVAARLSSFRPTMKSTEAAM